MQVEEYGNTISICNKMTHWRLLFDLFCLNFLEHILCNPPTNPPPPRPLGLFLKLIKEVPITQTTGCFSTHQRLPMAKLVKSLKIGVN